MTFSRLSVVLVFLIAAGTIAGSAATLVVGSSGLGASKEVIGQCQAAPTVTINDDGGAPAEITTVMVSGIDDSACAGTTLKITLVGPAGGAVSTEKSASIGPGDTSKTFNFTSEHIERGDVTEGQTVFQS